MRGREGLHRKGLCEGSGPAAAPEARGSGRIQGPGWGPRQLQRTNPQCALPRSLSLVLPPQLPATWGLPAPNPSIRGQGQPCPLLPRAPGRPAQPESKATANLLPRQIPLCRDKPPPRQGGWEARATSLIGIFQLREHSIPFSPVPFNHQVFSFLRRPEIAEIFGI